MWQGPAGRIPKNRHAVVLLQLRGAAVFAGAGRRRSPRSQKPCRSQGNDATRNPPRATGRTLCGETKRTDASQAHGGWTWAACLTWLRARRLDEGDTARLSGGAVERFDFRHLPSPEPLDCALGVAERLGAGQRACVLTPCWPAPLLGALNDMGVTYRARMLDEGGCEVILEVGRGPD